MTVDRQADIPLTAIIEAMAADGIDLSFQSVCDCQDPSDLLYRAALPGLRLSPRLRLDAAALAERLERANLTAQLDRALLASLFTRLIEDPEARLGCRLSSASFLYLKDWVALYDMLSRRPSLARRLVIELTETLPLMALSVVKQRIALLKTLGPQLAIDGFGLNAGAPTLAPMRGFDIVKIDAGYVRSVHVGRGPTSLERIVAAARALAPAVVISGIDTADQFDLARSAGASHVQGDLFDGAEAPVPPGYRMASLLAIIATKRANP